MKLRCVLTSSLVIGSWLFVILPSPLPRPPGYSVSYLLSARKTVLEIAPKVTRRGIWRARWSAIRSATWQSIWRETRRAAENAARAAVGRSPLQVARRIAGQVARKAVPRATGQTIRSGIRRAIRQIPRRVFCQSQSAFAAGGRTSSPRKAGPHYLLPGSG